MMFRIGLMFIIAIAQFPATGLSADPKQPIYGGRSPQDGSIQLNPQWTEPVTSLLSQSTAIVVVDTESKNRKFFKIPEQLQGDSAMLLLGPIIASVGSGEVVDVNDGERHVWIMTDQEGLAIANIVFPRALDTGSLDDAATKASGMSIEGRWRVSREELTPKTPERLAALAAWKVNTVTPDEIIFADSFETDAKQKKYHYRIDLGLDQPTITLSNLETQETISGAFWAHTGKEYATAFGFVALNEGTVGTPGSVEQSEWVTRFTFARDEDDPKWIETEVSEMRLTAMKTLLSKQVHLYRSARDALRYSILMEEEAKTRLMAEDARSEYANLEQQQKHTEATEMNAKADDLAIEAEQLKAARIDQQRRDAELQRQRSEADLLVQRIEMLRSEGQTQLVGELQQQLNGLLRTADDDNFRIVDLERRAVKARLDNNHAFAKQLQQEAADLRKTLEARYSGPTAAVESKSRPWITKTIVLQHSKADESIDVLKSLEMLNEYLSAVSPRATVIWLSGDVDKISEAENIIETIDRAAAVQRNIGGHVINNGPPNTEFLMQALKGLQGVDDSQVHDWTKEEAEIKTLVEQKGIDDPLVQDKLAMLGTRYRLYSGENHAFQVTDWDAVIARQQQRYEAAEQQAAITAAEYRKVSGATPADEGRRAQLKTELKLQVGSAFAIRLVLQLMQLEKASHDLRASQQRLKRRHALSDAIIQRRVDDLMSDAELSWFPKGGASQRDVRSASTAHDVSDLLSPNPKAETRVAANAKVLQLLSNEKAYIEKEILRIEARYKSFLEWTAAPDGQPTLKALLRRLELIDKSLMTVELERTNTAVKRAELEKLRLQAENTPADRRLLDSVKRIMGDDASNAEGNFDKAIKSLDVETKLQKSRLEQLQAMKTKEAAIAKKLTADEGERRAIERELDRKSKLLEALIKRTDELAKHANDKVEIETTDQGVIVLRGKREAVQRVSETLEQATQNQKAAADPRPTSKRAEFPAVDETEL